MNDKYLYRNPEYSWDEYIHNKKGGSYQSIPSAGILTSTECS